MQKTLDCFLTSSEGPSTSVSSTRTRSYSDNEEKYRDDEMSDYSTSNEDLERSDDDEQSPCSSNEGYTEDEDRMSTDESGKKPERKRPKKNTHHRKTGIGLDWAKQFKWLQEVRGTDGKLGMICKLCRNHGIVPRSGSKVWTTEPCFHVRLDKIKKHASSKMHKRALEAELHKATGGIPQAFSEALNIETKAAIGCCKCLYWLCKQEISHTTTYPQLLALAENLGCTYFKALNVGRNATYTSPQIVNEFLEVIDDLVSEDILSDMKGSGAFSIMVDESTDVSVLKQLVLYGRAVAGGKLKTHFLKIVDIEDGRATTIVDAITTYLCESAELDIGRLSSFGSDGASVMTGCRGGVATLLRARNSKMISVHCICHRLALATGQASNQVPYLKQMKDHLLALWKYFHFSTVRSAQLKSIQEIMESPELKIVKAIDTRWLSHKAAVTTLLRTLAAVFVTLQQQVDPTAVGLRTVLARYYFFASLVLLNDVLSAVNRLSLIFQRSAIDLTLVSPLLNSTILSLEKLQQESATEFEDKVKQLIATTTSEVHKLHQSSESQSEEDERDSPAELVQIRANDPERFEVSVRQKFLAEISTNLRDRFPQVDLLEAFSIFDPAGLLGQDAIAEEKLEILLDHYYSNDSDGPIGKDREICRKEYRDFVSFVQGHAKLRTCVSFQDLAQEILSKEAITHLFPTISELLVHALVLPVSTTDCERCFSVMNRVKTDLRNRMHTKTLDRLLRIRIEGPDLTEFNFNEAVKRWSKAKNRRLFGN